MSQHGCPERLTNRSKGFQEDGPSQPTMELLVETLTGTAFEMTVSPSDTIFAIKSKIFRVEGIPISQQHLLYNLKELEDASSLRELGIGDGARLRLVLGMRGGPISTRRLPAAAPDHAEPWPDIERLLDSTREEGGWSYGSGCKVTVLVFRDGERVNMLRVRENTDGTYSPLEHTKYSSSVTPVETASCSTRGAAAGSLLENAVTQGKMMEIRRRMETLSLQRLQADSTPDKVDIQKTRSEEILSVPSLLDDACSEEPHTPLYDAPYTRYDYDYAYDRLTLPPLISPIGTRAAEPEEEIGLSELAGSILVQRGDEAILEECLDTDQCRLRQDAETLAPIHTAEYGPVVGGGVRWVAGGVPAPAAGGGPRRAPHSHSASSLQLRAPRPTPRDPPLSDALFSSSTSELETLKRNSRGILPALSRHRNRSHLHLSDEGLHLHAPRDTALPAAAASPPHPPRRDPLRFEEYSDSAAAQEERVRFLGAAPAPAPPDRADKPKEKKIRIRCGLCKKRLSIATVHTCRCGADFCAPHRYAEVHGCAYDYKANAHQYLQRANPLVSAPKLPKI